MFWAVLPRQPVHHSSSLLLHPSHLCFLTLYHPCWLISELRRLANPIANPSQQHLCWVKSRRTPMSAPFLCWASCLWQQLCVRDQDTSSTVFHMANCAPPWATPTESLCTSPWLPIAVNPTALSAPHGVTATFGTLGSGPFRNQITTSRVAKLDSVASGHLHGLCLPLHSIFWGFWVECVLSTQAGLSHQEIHMIWFVCCVSVELEPRPFHELPTRTLPEWANL